MIQPSNFSETWFDLLLDGRPSRLGSRPSLVGWRPSLVGTQHVSCFFSYVYKSLKALACKTQMNTSFGEQFIIPGAHGTSGQFASPFLFPGELRESGSTWSATQGHHQPIGRLVCFPSREYLSGRSPTPVVEESIPSIVSNIPPPSQDSRGPEPAEENGDNILNVFFKMTRNMPNLGRSKVSFFV